MSRKRAAIVSSSGDGGSVATDLLRLLLLLIWLYVLALVFCSIFAAHDERRRAMAGRGSPSEA
jgi:hypothetical protein